MTNNVTICLEARHTPGLWEYDLDYIVAPDPDGRHPDIYIAEIAHSDDEGRIATPEQQDANRRLIAAAPELLEALLDALPYVEDVLSDPQQLACFKKGIVQGHAKAIRDAIAKATTLDSAGR